MKQKIRSFAVLTLIPLAFAACTGLQPASTSDDAQRTETAPSKVDESAPPSGQDAQARQLAASLEQRLAAKGPLDDVFVEAECYDDDEHFRSVEVYGDGLAVWDGHVQYSVQSGEILQMLDVLAKVHFTDLKDLYGSSAMRIICRVVLEIDGVRKQVAQRARGEQNETLKALANDIFDVNRQPASAGVDVASLTDGLDKIARGELSPRVFDLTLHHKPERTAELKGKNVGWLFRLHGTEASTRIYNDAQLDEPRKLDLGDAKLIELVNLLSREDVVGLPQNLYADKYTDFIIRVLKYESRVQARQFAGMTHDTHGQAQERFDRVLGAIRDLHEQTAREGTVHSE